MSDGVSAPATVHRGLHLREPILIVLLLGLLIGVLVTTQYGESWDELQFYKYTDRALEAYVTWPSSGQITLTGNTYDNYGPA